MGRYRRLEDAEREDLGNPIYRIGLVTLAPEGTKEAKPNTMEVGSLQRKLGHMGPGLMSVTADEVPSVGGSTTSSPGYYPHLWRVSVVVIQEEEDEGKHHKSPTIHPPDYLVLYAGTSDLMFLV
jgi:hypothetical protein